MHRRHVALRVAQVAFVLAVLWFGVGIAMRYWTELRALQATLRPQWGLITASAGVVLLSYALLIATWRGMVQAWGAVLPAAAAARIWFVSNLGRYLPGKVWQLGAMGVMASDAGVPASAAVGSSLVLALVNVLAGFAVVAVAGAESFRAVGAEGPSLWIPLSLLGAVIVSLPWTLGPLIRFTGRVTRREVLAPTLPAAAVWLAAAGCVAAWVLYGLAFRLLAIGLLGPDAAGEAGPYVAVFTLSYLAGFLALFAPGGIGIREVTLGGLLVAAGLATGPQATLLVVASRLWLTVLEIVPGLFFIAWRSPRVPAPPAP